jgi:hypothetical protein
MGLAGDLEHDLIHMPRVVHPRRSGNPVRRQLDGAIMTFFGFGCVSQLDLTPEAQ